MSLCGFGLTALRTHRSLVNIKCRHVASSRKVTGWDASRADSTKTPLCVQSVCVCVSLLDRTSRCHTFTPARTHLSALCVTGSNTVSPADSAQRRQPEPTQTDTFVFSVVVVLLPLLWVGSHAGSSLWHCLFPTFSFMSQ